MKSGSESSLWDYLKGLKDFAICNPLYSLLMIYCTGINEVEGGSNEVEIGYGICKKYSGKGYATELLKAMTEFSVETFRINVLYGRVMHGNNASVKALEKNGYEFVREEFGTEDDPYGNGMLIYKNNVKSLLCTIDKRLMAG